MPDTTIQKIALVTDAWYPQVNGVVRVTETIVTLLRKRGFEVMIIDPSQFINTAMPMYREIRLALFPSRKLTQMLDSFKPDAIHCMTEGTLGFAAKRYAQKRNLPFTTWYHTHFHYYIDMRFPGLRAVVMRIARHFHNSAAKTFVSTESLGRVLSKEGFTKLTVVPLGVDTEKFKRNLSPNVPAYQKPVYVFFSRLAQEKNPKEFLDLYLDGTKLVIGDGPDRAKLEKKYGVQNGGDSTFVGFKKGQELVDYLSAADVMVFPSKTETFGLTALEAMACGVPVAAHDVLGPRDIITHGRDGFLEDNLADAAERCLTLNREDCRAKALQFTWEKSADAFVKNLVKVRRI